jgi:hypothetical protein
MEEEHHLTAVVLTNVVASKKVGFADCPAFANSQWIVLNGLDERTPDAVGL